MSKTKLLMIGDAGMQTGFEKVVRNVATQLQATGKYDITIRGIGYDPDTALRAYPCTVKPTGATFGDPCGIQQFDDWMEEDQPDVIWTVQDLWNIAGYLLFKPPAVPMVTYIPVDTPNVLWGNAIALSAVSEVVAYTKFGARELAIGVRSAVDMQLTSLPLAARNESVDWFATPKLGRELIGRADRLARWSDSRGYNVIPHGFEPGVFEPRSRDFCRNEFSIPKNAFVVMNVGTNQFRKRLDLTLRAFAAFAKGKSNALLVLHCAGSQRTIDGYNLAQLAQLYGIADKVRLIHQEALIMSDDRLCNLYNCANVHINTSGGEGWGLCSMESAACGVAQIVPDWSATREIWAGAAPLIRVADYRIEPKQIVNAAHAVVSVTAVRELLDMFYGADDSVEPHWGQLALDCATRQKTWEQVGNAFDMVLENALRESAPRAMSLAQVAGECTESGRSEVADWFL